MLGVVASALFILLERTQPHIYFYREQHQLFLWSWSEVWQRLHSFGGVSLVLTQFVIQFYAIPKIGALSTATLSALASFALYQAITKSRNPPNTSLTLAATCCLPFITEAVILNDTMLSYQSFISLVLASLSLLGGTALNNWFFRTDKGVVGASIVGMIISFVSVIVLGSAGVLFSIAFTCLQLSNGPRCMSTLLGALLSGWICVRCGWSEDYLHTFLPTGYYETLLSAPFHIYISWITLCTIVVLSCVLQKWSVYKNKKRYSVPLLILLGTLIFAWNYSAKIPKSLSYSMLRLYRYINEEQWQKILDDPHTRNSTNYLIMNCRNLALSHLGRLPDDLFKYPQKGSQSILAGDSESRRDVDITCLDAAIYYRMGNVAAAMNSAFDTFTGIPYGSPSAAKILVNTNLVLGYIPIADKYIRMLSKTCRYASWAHERKFFIESGTSDADLSRLKANTYPQDAIALIDSPFHDLERIIKSNPKDSIARGWLLSYMLLEKDLERLQSYIEANYGTPALESLPNVLQEAILVYAEDDIEYGKKYGVSEETIERYRHFRKRFIDLRDSRSDPTGTLRHQFGNTFWYYYLFQPLN